MNFEHASNLGLIAFLLLPIALILFSASRKKNHLLKTCFNFNNGTSHYRSAMYQLIGLFFLILAFSGPRWGYTIREVKRIGSDIFILIDTSDSMQATDQSPSRLERAKREIIDLTQMLKGDRIGLIPFAGKSYVACPLTYDYNAFQIFLDTIDVSLIPIKGTNHEAAIKLALSSFDKKTQRLGSIILITDGESTLGDLSHASMEAKKKGIKIYIIGTGTMAGAPIPNPDGGGFKTDMEGNIVISKMNEADLKNMAFETGGIYVRSETGDIDLEKIYYEGIHQEKKESTLAPEQKKIPRERFQIPLLLAFCFYLLDLKMKNRGIT